MRDESTQDYAIGTVPSFLPAALAASSVGTWDYDVRKDRLCCDETMARLFDIPPLVARRGISIERIMALIHPADRARVREKRGLMLERGGLFVIEYRIVVAKGQSRWILSRGCYDADATGEVVTGRGVAIDVTDEKSEGYADGDLLLTAVPEPLNDQDCLNRAAEYALATRKAIDGMKAVDVHLLRSFIDGLLLEIGIKIARLTVRS